MPNHDNDTYDDDYPGACQECDDGMIMACPDDMCRGMGYCPWDPPRVGCYVVCPYCDGDG